MPARPRNAPADRAFAAVVATHDLPRTLPEALLEGFAWDAAGRRYDTLSGPPRLLPRGSPARSAR